MKFFKLLQFLTLILLLVVNLQPLQAQGNRDFMRETGKIYVVTGVILIIFAGIVLYLVRLDKKLTNIEHQLKEGKNE
jgi:CcmD family protein